MSLTLLSNNAITFAENQHATSVLEKLKQQREMLRCCDVILHVAGEKYHAHRCVLSACSPFFDSLFKASKVVKEQLKISADRPDVFQCLLTYMYTGTVIVDSKNVSELLKLADKLLLFKLKDYCAEYLERYLSTENCLTVLDMANRFNLQSLQRTVTKLISTYLPKVIQGEEIMEFSLAKLEIFLKNSDWGMSEIERLELVTAWVNHKAESRESNLHGLLTLVAWEEVPLSSLKKILTDHPLYKSQKSLSFLLKVLDGNKLPRNFYEECLKIKVGYCRSPETEFDSNQVLKMAISTAIEELSVDNTLLKDKNSLPDVLTRDDISSNSDSTSQHFGGVRHNRVMSPRLDHLLEFDQTFRKANCTSIFDGYPNDPSYEVVPSESKGYNRSVFSEFEAASFDNLPHVSNFEGESSSQLAYSDKYVSYQRETKKQANQPDYSQGVNLSYKTFSANPSYDNELDSKMENCEQMHCNSSTNFQEPLKNLSFEDTNYSQLGHFYAHNQPESSRDPYHPPVSGTTPPNNIDLDWINRMNPDDQARVIQALHDDIGVCHDNLIHSSEMKGPLALNVNSTFSSSDYPLEYTEETGSSNSPRDMTLLHLRLGQDATAEERNLTFTHKDDISFADAEKVSTQREERGSSHILVSSPSESAVNIEVVPQIQKQIDATPFEQKKPESYGKLEKLRRCLLEEKQNNLSEEKTATPPTPKKVISQRKNTKKKNKNLQPNNKKKKQEERECDLCHTMYTSSRDYYMHMRQHFPGPPHQCSTCQASFNRIYHLLDHRNTHSEDKPFKCDLCDFSTKKRFNLKEHQILHSQVKPFKCDDCGMAFSRKQFLETHRTKHTTERPFMCHSCAWTGKTRNSLHVHSKIHTGDLYSCQYPDCPYKTPKISHLNEHLQYHSRSRPFACSVCSEGFITNSHLKRHMEKHDRRRLKTCPHCDFSCSRVDGVKIHIKRMHSADKQKGAPLPRKRQLRKKDAMLSNAAANFALPQETQPHMISSTGDGLQPPLSTPPFGSYAPTLSSPPYSFDASDDPEVPLTIASESEDNPSLDAFT